MFQSYRNAIRVYPPYQHPAHGPVRLVSEPIVHKYGAIGWGRS